MNANATSPSRVYIIGMQSSGSTLFSYFLAQVPDSLAVTDLWVRQPVPELKSSGPVSLKTCICEVGCFHQDVRVFQPTLSILYVRNPVDIYRSLRKKWYYHDGGSFESKMAAFEQLYIHRNEWFDLTVHYEEFATDPWKVGKQLKERGVALPDDALSFPRPLDQIEAFAMQNDDWCRHNFGLRWTHANIHTDKLAHITPISYGVPTEEELSFVRELCPTVAKAYADADYGQ